MTSATTLAEEVSNTLLKVLPRASDVVDHYREQAIWDQAIIETLAIIAKTEKPEIPANVADEVRGLFGRKETGKRSVLNSSASPKVISRASAPVSLTHAF